MNDQDEDDLRRGLRAMVADPPRVAATTELIAAAQARRRRNRAGTVVLAVLVAAVVAVPSVLAMREGGAPPAPVVAAPAPSPSPGDGAAGEPSAPGTGLATGPASPAVGQGYRYDLFVHCGIRFAKFGGRWWQADPGQPEPRSTYGGGNYLPGTMTLISADEARFTAEAPEVSATFRPLAGDPEPCD